MAPNTSASGVRAAQYLSMMPALESHRELRRSRVESWRTLSTPEWNKTLVGDATRHESLRYGPATLTDLGAKLLGLRSWHRRTRSRTGQDGEAAGSTAGDTAGSSGADAARRAPAATADQSAGA